MERNIPKKSVSTNSMLDYASPYRFIRRAYNPYPLNSRAADVIEIHDIQISEYLGISMKDLEKYSYEEKRRIYEEKMS